MGIARGTVEQTISLLVDEGYLVTKGQAGTRINPHLNAPASKPVPEPVTTESTELAPSVEQFGRPVGLLPFQMDLPALDSFPRKTWAQLCARYLRGIQIEQLDYPPPHGMAALRSAIASYLQLARGITCGSHQIFITNGFRTNLQFVVQTLMRRGDRAWVEDPGYPPTRQILSRAGVQQVAITVDEFGIDVGQGVALASNARLAVVTPAHQSPPIRNDVSPPPPSHIGLGR